MREKEEGDGLEEWDGEWRKIIFRNSLLYTPMDRQSDGPTDPWGTLE